MTGNLEEGKDFLSKNSVYILETDNVRADNMVVNMITNRFNKELKQKGMSDDYYVVGEDLFSTLKEDPVLFAKKEDREEVFDE